MPRGESVVLPPSVAAASVERLGSSASDLSATILRNGERDGEREGEKEGRETGRLVHTKHGHQRVGLMSCINIFTDVYRGFSLQCCAGNPRVTRREGAFHKDDDMQGRPRLPFCPGGRTCPPVGVFGRINGWFDGD